MEIKEFVPHEKHVEYRWRRKGKGGERWGSGARSFRGAWVSPRGHSDFPLWRLNSENTSKLSLIHQCMHLVYQSMTCVRTLKLSYDSSCPSQTPPCLMMGTWPCRKSAACHQTDGTEGKGSQGPYKSKKYVYWGQCSQLGHRGSCLCWPKANKPVVKRMKFLNMTGSNTSFHFIRVTMQTSHGRETLSEGDRVNGHGWLPSQNKRSRTRASRSVLFAAAKVDQMISQMLSPATPKDQVLKQ